MPNTILSCELCKSCAHKFVPLSVTNISGNSNCAKRTRSLSTVAVDVVEVIGHTSATWNGH